MNIFIECLVDALFDLIKLLPFLFLTYLLMEYLEGHLQDRFGKILKKAGKAGPVLGAVLGIVPQCGFSSVGANLFAGRLLSIGTVVAVFLSTSDEMLPLFVSAAAPVKTIITILLVKAIIAMFAGLLVDFINEKILKAQKIEADIHHFCEHEHCDCGHGIFKPALLHTLRIGLFIFVITLALNIIASLVGFDRIAGSVLNNSIAGVAIACLIGLIPNCGASVAIATLYLDGVIELGTMIAGLLVGAGVGLLILFKVNDNKKENFSIIGILLVTGFISGLVINAIL